MPFRSRQAADTQLCSEGGGGVRDEESPGKVRPVLLSSRSVCVVSVQVQRTPA